MKVGAPVKTKAEGIAITPTLGRLKADTGIFVIRLYHYPSKLNGSRGWIGRMRSRGRRCRRG